MKQVELADRAYIRPATISEMYHELIERVNLDNLSRICEVLDLILDCEVSEILEYVPHKSDHPIMTRAEYVKTKKDKKAKSGKPHQ